MSSSEDIHRQEIVLSSFQQFKSGTIKFNDDDHNQNQKEDLTMETEYKTVQQQKVRYFLNGNVTKYTERENYIFIAYLFL